MAKGAYLTPRIKNLIAKIYLEHRDYGPTKAREELLKKMKEEGLEKIFGTDFPSVSSVSKQLKEYHDRDEERLPESKELDKPWSFSSLAKYPIAPEAIPLVVSIYEKCLMEDAPREWFPSIREALWTGRLHKIIELYQPRHILPDVRDAIQEAIIGGRERPIELKEKNPTNQELALAWGLKGKEIPLEDIVLEWAYTYSQYEIMSEIEGKPFDSGELDGYMMIDVYEFYGDRRNDFIGQIAEKYGVDEDKLRDLNLPIGVIERAAAISGKYEYRLFNVPVTEKSKIFSKEELEELEVVGMQNGLVYMVAKKDASDRLLHKLMKHQIYYSREAQNERIHTAKG